MMQNKESTGEKNSSEPYAVSGDRFSYTISETDINLSIKMILKYRLGLSSRLLRKLKNENAVFLNNKRIKLFEKGLPGDLITLSLPEETSGFEPEPIPIDVIYEDDDLLILNKQPGYVVHPTKGHPGSTIANGIMKYMLDKGDSYKIRFINRLDMDTSGILLIGKNSHCQDDFAKQAENGRVVKKYLAILKGIVENDEGIIDLPIGKPDDNQIKRAVIPDGYPSVTRYRVLERYKDCTFAEITLETGRTHQIRVHMEYIGNPVLGDLLYGAEAAGLIGRQALHASQLEFDHPVTKQRMSVKAAMPEDMRNLLNNLGTLSSRISYYK